MNITIEINGETWVYNMDNPDFGSEDFMDAVIPIESLLKAIYPSFGNHQLIVVCPNGEPHDLDEICEFVQDFEVDPDDPKDAEKTEEAKNKGIDLPSEENGGKENGKKD